jgi:hypothetical protein
MSLRLCVFGRGFSLAKMQEREEKTNSIFKKENDDGINDQKGL